MDQPLQADQSRFPLLTKTKTRTKTMVFVAVGLALIGGLAWAGVVRQQRARTVCNSGPNAGQECSRNEDCKRPEARNARCVKAGTLSDLAVQSVTFDPETRLPTVVVVNQGRSTVTWSSPPDLSLQVFDATGAEIFEGQRASAIYAMAPGETRTYDWPFTVMPVDAVRMRITLDIRFQVVEANEDNNVWEGDIPPPLPPALPDLHNLFERIPDTPTEGEQFTLRVQVQNLGAESAGVSISSLQLDRGNDGTVDETLPTRAISAIAAGATAEAVEWSWPTWSTGGPHRLVVCADSGSTVTESDEENNCTTIVVVANPAPTVAGRMIFALHPASPSGAVVPGVNEVLRFTLTAPDVDVLIHGFSFRLNTTDNNGTGSTGGDWNTWQASNETIGLNGSDFRFYDVADLSTPVAATWRFWNHDISTGEFTELTGDEHSGGRPYAISFAFTERPVIAGGTSKVFSLGIDSTGASTTYDDTLRVFIDDVLANPRNPEGLPLAGGRIQF